MFAIYWCLLAVWLVTKCWSYTFVWYGAICRPHHRNWCWHVHVHWGYRSERWCESLAVQPLVGCSSTASLSNFLVPHVWQRWELICILQALFTKLPVMCIFRCYLKFKITNTILLHNVLNYYCNISPTYQVHTRIIKPQLFTLYSVHIYRKAF